MIVVIVHRYDEPEDKFGLHTSHDNGDTFETIGLFEEWEINQQVTAMETEASTHQIEMSTDELIPLAPIEWHALMREGEMLDRFKAFETTPLPEGEHNE